MDSHERKVLDSHAFQRLRHINQLALTCLIYPGATHKRFEHSLGVMELASRVFDVITRPENISDPIRNLLPELERDGPQYWRRVLRMAALCHDLGHLAFSHAAERDLLPEGWDHERITREIISSPEMNSIWTEITPPLRCEDIIRIAVGPKKAPDLEFTDWQAILAEIVVGDAFGVDRMDYLLRDSHHAGVAYGKFDQYRLIDTIRILPPAPFEGQEGSSEPALGVEQGGIQSAEALVLARYFMYSQVYFHPIRRIYDIHLKDFLKAWLSEGRFSTDIDQHLRTTDNEVTAAYMKSAYDKNMPGHIHARRIVCREHFKVIYERNPKDVETNPDAGNALFTALCAEFGAEHFRHDRYTQESGAPDFPVRMRDGSIVSSLAISETLNKVPMVNIDYIFADRSVLPDAEKWLKRNRHSVIQPLGEEMTNG
ncbi:MAG TPA: HD domain-containing protein [bacterium]|nr:HD domain-containing protein [bacterium]